MIATRRRPFRLPIMAFVKTVGVLLILYVLVRLPFTHKLIFDGPLKPMWAQAESVEQKFIAPWLDPIIEPVTAVNLVRKVGERNNEIIALKKQLRGAEYEQKMQRQQIRDLQSKGKRSGKAMGPAVASAVGASNAVAAPAAATAAGSSASSPLVQVTPSPDESKTAAYWSAMEAETAAGVAQKLDPAQTARIFLAMKSDQAAEIMNALPADYNVKLQQVRLSYPKSASGL